MTIITTYTSPQKADQVLDTLINMGVLRSDISVGANKTITENNSHLKEHADTGNEHAAKETSHGAFTGGLLGGALAFLSGAAVIAGFPGLLIVGPLAGALTALGANAAVGAAVGTIGGALMGMFKAGVDEAKAKEIDDIITSGGVMLAIQNPNDEVAEYLKNSHPQNYITV
jgi:uncharacterized membrane protein